MATASRKMDVKIFLMFIVAENTGSVNIGKKMKWLYERANDVINNISDRRLPVFDWRIRWSLWTCHSLSGTRRTGSH